VLRYFESREAVLLELLDRAAREWLEQLAGELRAGLSADAEPPQRGDQLAPTIATSLSARPVSCALVSAEAEVLEQIAANYKRRSRTSLSWSP
jgi:AcrR family transcriptional regulator